MNSLVRKFIQGAKTDLKHTLIKSILYILKSLGNLVADILYFIYRVLIFPLPARTLARLKYAISPSIRLDYERRVVKLKADSMVDFFRARACEKEPETVEWIETYVKAGDIFFDIGANIGAYSLIATAYHQGDLTVHSFEPSFSTYHQLCRNIIENGFQKSITPYMVGLTDKVGMVSFHYRSLDAGRAEHWLGADVSENSASQFVYSQQLFGFSMDHLIESFGLPVPNHIKLDVDGTEVEVLHGAEKTLQREGVKSILVEVRDVDGMSATVDEILVSKGFHLASKIDRGGGVIWNCIYARDNVATKNINS